MSFYSKLKQITRLYEVPWLILTPLGRWRLRRCFLRELWPVLRYLAILYRRTFLRRTRVIVVVGSLGKTTTVSAVNAALGSKRQLRDDNAFEEILEAMLRVRPGARHAIFEVGIDGPGQMSVYAGMLQPDVTVVTSISSEHNRSFGTLENTRDEKVKMVSCLSPSGLAVLNGDDPNVLWMQSQTKVRVITFGFNEANDVRGSNVSMSDWPDGSRFTVHSHGQSVEMFIRLIGSPGIYATLAATAVALAEGYTLEDVQQRLGSLAPIPGRLQPVELESGAIILRDDFKSPLETMLVALDVLSQIPARRRMVVFGRVTEPQGKQGDIYRDLGKRVAAVAERAVFVCSKSDSSYRAGAIQMGMPPEAITKAGSSLFKAAEAIKQELGEGDVVLIKGSNTQRMERITLFLQGRTVMCKVINCRLRNIPCEGCPALEKGYGASVGLPKPGEVME